MALGLLLVFRSWSKRKDTDIPAFDKEIKVIQDKLATVEAVAIEKKAVIRAKTEDHIKLIKEAASEVDPKLRRKKLAEQLNSL